MERQPDFYCSICDDKFKSKNWWSREIHLMRLHSNKIITEAIDKYTKILVVDE